MWAVTVVVLGAVMGVSPLPPPPSCTHLQGAYTARGVPRGSLPHTPVPGTSLELCPSPSSCCSSPVEQGLGSWAGEQYRERLDNWTLTVAQEMDTRATQVDDYIYVLLNKAQRDFHDMFTRTYGVMYQRNAEVFQEYFQDLKIYYDKGNLNPLDSTASFFTTLYQKMFKVLNTQYTFDGLYLSCVAENIDQLRPFGDVPRKIATSVKRSLMAARALVKALRTGHDVVRQMNKVPVSSTCLTAVQKMSVCPACQGLPEVRPCTNYCTNVMKGCLAHHYELDELWAKFTESLTSLSERLVGPFNVEMTVEPISIKISDAIMNFQESGFQVTQKVFELCGTPRLGRRQAGDNSPFVFEKRLEKSHRPSSRPNKSEFEKMLIDLKKKLREFGPMWKDMPHKMCETESETPYKHIVDSETCWNGKDAGSYEDKVVEDGLENQQQNPEVPVTLLEESKMTMLDEQKFKLQSVTNVLKSAYRGQDVEWWDDEVEGEGSGGDLYDYTDDEDGFGSGDDSTEGSGGRDSDEEDEEDAIIVPSWTAGKVEQDVGFSDEEEERVEWNPWPKFPTSTTTVQPVTGGTSSVHLKSRWAVARAVIVYSLPMATCYFGGFLTDVPWIFQ